MIQNVPFHPLLSINIDKCHLGVKGTEALSCALATDTRLRELFVASTGWPGYNDYHEELTKTNNKIICLLPWNVDCKTTAILSINRSLVRTIPTDIYRYIFLFLQIPVLRNIRLEIPHDEI